jgi:hypothetical protein
MRPTTLAGHKAARNPALLAALAAAPASIFAAGDQVAVTFDGDVTLLHEVKYTAGLTVWLTNGSSFDTDAQGRFDGGVVEKATVAHLQAVARQQLCKDLCRASAARWTQVPDELVGQLAAALKVSR